MIILHNDKTYLVDGKLLPAETFKGDEQLARKGTISFKILSSHNLSNGDKLGIKFDSIGVYDNTYVGIMQTARACGLKEFTIPTVFTNCHNALCAVGGTINADLHKYAYSICKKYGGIFVPPHMAVIHQYMREMIIKSGSMAIVSDSHTRYGALGSLSIGEGGPEIVKAMLGKEYELDYPKIIAVYLKNAPAPWIGPMDVALTIIGAVFKNNFVKNCVLEFIGPGIKNLSMDFRNGVDTMTTESACLSSIWETDALTEEFFAVHGRQNDYQKIQPDNIALYDKAIEIDLAKVESMIAMPFHPSNVYKVADVIGNYTDVINAINKNAEKTFVNNDVHFNWDNKIKDGRLSFDQGIIAGCAAGSFENIYIASNMAAHLDKTNIPVNYDFDIYPASQPVYSELTRLGATGTLINNGVKIKTAFCGPCFGAGDTPANNSFSLRHVTRNFPNREGSDPTKGQLALVALADARTIAATSYNGGILASAQDYPEECFIVPKYDFNNLYSKHVYFGFKNPLSDTAVEFGPSIKDWPKMQPLGANLLLKIATVIYDEVTTTDELIPSGETASYRSDPYKISEYTLIRKDPEYRRRAKEIRRHEQDRLEHYENADPFIQDILGELNKTHIYNGKNTELGSVVYAKRPGDGSAREYAASCQRVLGGVANICLEYATKRYRSNCINWGIIPFKLNVVPEYFRPESYIFIPNIRNKIENGEHNFQAFYIGDSGIISLNLTIDDLTTQERDILLAGSLINYYQMN